MKIRTRFLPTVIAIFHACRDPRTPMAIKIVAIALCLYAISPIDLVSDFIPVLGWLDDVAILSFGFYILSKFFPKDVWKQAKERAARPIPPNP